MSSLAKSIQDLRYLARTGQFTNYLAYQALAAVNAASSGTSTPHALAGRLRKSIERMAFGVREKQDVLDAIFVSDGMFVVQIGAPLLIVAEAISASALSVTYKGYDCSTQTVAECTKMFAEDARVRFMETGCYHTIRNPRGKGRMCDWVLNEEPQTVDVVLCPSLFADFPSMDVRRLLAQVYDALKPQGRFITSGYFANPISTRQLDDCGLRVLNRDMGAGEWRPMTGRQDLIVAIKPPDKSQ